ncbi:MAG: hypothetical protein LBI82_03745 [Dysgonamonadaceae bacterium]|jgi:hypothetical protein|nr:hypothetical protein [Dysgonamonadaceae bacterium]
MKNTLLFLLLFLCVFCGYAQTPLNDDAVTIDLGTANLSPEQERKMNAAFEVMDAVEKAGRYIQSLSDLFSDGTMTLPVGIKQGDYILAVDKVTMDKNGRPVIHATCAFKFKDTGQKIAFEGQAVLAGKSGIGTAGRLELITEVRRNMGKESALVIHEGTAVNFGCEGVESFEAKISWVATSPNIIAVNANGVPTNKPLATTFTAKFRNFDDFSVSLNINQSFSIKGLNDMIFTLKGAVLDQSDTETPGLVRFPAGYFAQSNQETIKLWKGLYISEASVSLPAIFKKPESSGNERLTVALQETLFDENGFTGSVAVKNLLPGENIKPDSWDISLTDFSLGILKNNIVAFGFGGELNIPPFGKNSLCPYMATINPLTNEYDFRVGIAGKYDFPVLHSTIALNELSRIDILFKESEIYPTIHASGLLTVNAPLGADTTKVFSVPDITFENMVISRESPYLKIGAIGVTGELRSPKLAGFELSITNIDSFTDNKGSGLAFTTGITLNETFGGLAGLKLYGDYAHWKFREVEVDRVKVDYRSSSFSLSGGVWFKNGDKIFGDGFRGDISLTLIDKFTFDAVGIFGKKDDFRYFLADAMYEMSPPGGIPVPPALNFYGFGGGLYRRMQQASKMPQQTTTAADLEFGKSLSGISYFPEKQVGLGVMATTKFALSGSSTLFNAKVGFEMQFNDRGGLNFVQLRGDAAFVDNPNKWGNLTDNVNEQTYMREKSGATQPKKANKSDLEKLLPENKSSGFLTASLNIEYDFNNKTFIADMNTYLNAGVIRGVGTNDRLGWASAYFSPDKWYTYLGTPADRLGVKVLNLAELNGYFMLGADIPALPPPPQKVLKNLSADKQAKLARNNSNNLSTGKGMAFGAAFDMNFKAKLTPFYAKFGVGLGAEFMLTDLRGRTCSNYSGTPGLNGWYAQGQAWAYIDADIGVEAKVFGKRRSFNILDLSLGALLEGAGPNPMYFSGNVGGRFSVLGGLVKGKCSFDFEIGESCILSTGSPFGEDVIAQLSPGEGDREINVFSAPQAVFNIPIGEQMIIDEDDVKGTYMASLEEFSVKYKDTGRAISGRNKISEDGTVSMFSPDEPFESQKEVEVYAKVAFMKKENNYWVYVKGDDGKPVVEDKKAVFRTGDRPKEIQPEHVAYSYPINRQYNYYPKESDKGYIQLSQNYAYLFSTEKPEGFDQKIRISDASGKNYEKPFTYKTGSAGNNIRMEIDFSTEQVAFEKNKIYKLAIVNIPQAQKDMKSNISSTTTAVEGQEDMEITRQQATEVLAQLSEKEIYALNFRSSNYDSFYQKVKAFDKQSEGWRDYVEPFVHYIKTNLKDAELFDTHEIQGINNQKIVRFNAQIAQTNWFNQSFYKDMYQSQTYIKPPVEKVEILTGLPDKQLTNDEMSINAASGYNTQGIFRYVLPYWCARDFFTVKENIAKKALQGQITQQEAKLLGTDFPPVVFKGDYPVNVSYVLPGREITTSTVNITMYNPVEP